jgi:hypothetical protein
LQDFLLSKHVSYAKDKIGWVKIRTSVFLNQRFYASHSDAAEKSQAFSLPFPAKNERELTIKLRLRHRLANLNPIPTKTKLKDSFHLLTPPL